MKQCLVCLCVYMSVCVGGGAQTFELVFGFYLIINIRILGIMKEYTACM